MELKLRILAPLSLVLVAAAVSGCGASKTNSTLGGTTTSASRLPVTDTSAPADKAWAYCNQGTSASNHFNVHLAAYEENGKIRTDLMYVRLSNLSNSFSSGDGYFQFFRWHANTNHISFDSTAVSLKVVRRSDGAVVLTSRNYLRWSELGTAASQLGVTTPDEFFQKAWIVVDLKDTLGQYDVLKTVLYKSVDNTSMGDNDSLLPIFAADPAIYATDNDGTARHPHLKAIHPFASKDGQGWTIKDYQTWANQLCQAFQ